MSQTNKKNRTAFVIMKREICSYFTSPIAYIVTGLFLLAAGFWFFKDFFLYRQPELRNYFSSLPIILSFFIPALTMRMIAEEKKSGSIETLLTLPVTITDVVIGKFLASFVCGAVMIAPTLLYTIPCFIFGDVEIGPIIGGFLGSLFLIAAFSAIGLLATSLTKNQIISFFIAFTICIVLSVINVFAVFLPSSIVTIVNYFCAATHFQSVSRGVIDTRDLIYFISVTAIFISSAVMTLKSTASNK